MPIYEYECSGCGHRFEYLVLATSPAAECPACAGKDLTQLISLCGMSSEGTRDANLSAAHKRAASVRGNKQREAHDDHHRHFEDGTHP